MRESTLSKDAGNLVLVIVLSINSSHTVWFVLPFYLPDLSVVLYESDSNVASLDVLDSRKDLLNVHPVDNMLAIDMIARDLHDIRLSNQAKGLSHLHCRLWLVLVERSEECSEGKCV
jgi:hypothetical protein